MKSSDEKNRQKELLKELKLKEKQAFINSLPFETEKFKDLFGFLNVRLGEEECDDTLSLTLKFLREQDLYSENAINFLGEQGGYCDCEVLNNIEEKFEGL